MRMLIWDLAFRTASANALMESVDCKSNGNTVVEPDCTPYFRNFCTSAEPALTFLQPTNKKL